MNNPRRLMGQLVQCLPKLRFRFDKRSPPLVSFHIFRYSIVN